MIRGIRLLHMIAALSCLSIFGIFAWSVESINEGGGGFTPTLVFFVYILFLLACNAETIATEETLRKAYDSTKKLYQVVKSNGNVKKIDIFEHYYSQRSKHVIYGVIVVATISFAFIIHTTVVKSVMMSFFLSIGFFYLFLTMAIVTWNIMGIKKLGKIKKSLK